MKTRRSNKKSKIKFVVVGWVVAIVLTSAESAGAAAWTQKADMPTARVFLASSVVNGKIYAIGGMVAINNSPATKIVEEYDPATDTWTRKADMPTARVSLASSAVDGKIYAIGGVPSLQSSNAFATVEAYDPMTDTWTKKADMPAVRSDLATSVVNGKIYVIGGWWIGGNISILLEYDPATDTWTAEDDMPVKMLGMSASLVGGRIYVIGGTSTPFPFPPLSTVWEYYTAPSPDFNGDGIVDSKDASIMVDHWHTDNALYDIAPLPFGDSFVDVQDLISLSEQLFEEVNDPSLIAHWALDETDGDIAYDSAGLNDAIVFGGALWQPTGGTVGGAIQLDGIDDYAVAGPVLNPADGPFSILAWVQGGAPGQVFISQEGAANWLLADPSGGNLMTELGVYGRAVGPLLSQTTITDGNWHRVGLVWDGSDRILYVDGIEVARDTQSGLGSSEGGLYIGTGKDMALGTYWSGLIDEVRIYNRAVKP